MGKKSKKKSSGSADPSVALQELQSHVNSLSLVEAMRAVKAATSNLNQLKEQQQRAMEDIKRAKQEVVNSTQRKENCDLYDKKEFWNERYQEQAIYEWYLPFETLKDCLFPDLNACSNLPGEVIVAGCGNSTLCEDLWRCGYRSICGLDYSTAVIQAMTARAKSMSSLRYLHADACALPSFMNDYTCRAVIDKGTLDAIASGGESDSAIRYLNEMWRILNPNGRFLIVSTMPPHLFDLLAVSIVSSHDYSVKSLKTPEGGDVFYYSLERRTRPISADLESLLRETRNAQKQMEELLQKTLHGKEVRDQAAVELAEAKSKQQELEEMLNCQWQVMTDSLAKESLVNADHSLTKPLPLFEAPIKVKVPEVRLVILPDQSTLVTGGYVLIEYFLSAGEWDEDDFISLHEYGPTTEFSSPEPVTFEYTTSPNPTPDGKYLRGTLKLSLPFYGGLFYLQYQRVDVTIVPVVSTTSPGEVFEDVPLELEKSQSALVTRENIPLAKSSPFSITFSLQHRNRTCRANRGRGYSQLAATTNIDYLIEDLSNISTVMISVISIGCHFGKPTGWIESDHSGGIRLLLECDRSTTGKLQECDWISITIPSTRSYIWKDSYGVVEGDSESSPWGTRIVINIPYSSSSVTAVSSKPLESLSHDLSGLHCRVCDSFILDSSVISSLRPLPSGLFDQLMHEYLCSETPPTMPLSMAEYTSPSEEISVGHIYFSVHPNDILENSSLLFKCKLTPSLLDVLGGSFGMKLLPQVGLSDNSATLSLVDISTCGVSCSRCQTILGDGLIAVDAIETEHSSNEIHLNDLQDIRFLRSSVVWRSCGHEAEWGAKELVKLLTEPCNIEQVLSNTFLWLVNRYDVSSFEIAVPDWSESNRVSLRIRLLSRSQKDDDQQVQSGYSIRQGLCDDPAVFLRPAIKVSWRFMRPEDATKKEFQKAVVVPVSFSEFAEVSEILEVRSKYFGPSFLSGELLGFMLQ